MKKIKAVEEPKLSLVPSSFMLGGVKWHVNFLQKLEDDDLGDCYDADCQIRLSLSSRDIPIVEEKIQETFFHELTHAILYSMGSRYTYKESFVQVVGALTYQFVKSCGIKTLPEFKIVNKFTLFGLPWSVVTFTREEQIDLNKDNVPIDRPGGVRDSQSTVWFVTQGNETKDKAMFLRVFLSALLGAFDHSLYKDQVFCTTFSAFLLQAFTTATYNV